VVVDKGEGEVEDGVQDVEFPGAPPTPLTIIWAFCESGHPTERVAPVPVTFPARAASVHEDRIT
jgi:hypothetical protein